MIRCYTSVTNNYIPKARVLAHSVKKIHPDWEFTLVNAEPLPDSFSLDHEPFDVILTPERWAIPNLEGWLFKHRVVEICTAIKGKVADYLINLEDTEKVIYLDPDIVVFNSLEPLLDKLEEFSIILTPHILTPQRHKAAVMDNEISALKHGVYNLGFVAISKKSEGVEFAQWWKDRLLEFCYDDIPNGLFTDQKWIDLAPAFFENLFILRDPGYNVASWNLSHRKLGLDIDGTLIVNDKYPLRFYHFTGYDSGVGAIMTERYAKENTLVSEIWAWYQKELQKQSIDGLENLKWQFSFFNNGRLISDEMRLLYRNREDVQKYFKNPFDTLRQDGGYLAWYETEAQLTTQ